MRVLKFYNLRLKNTWTKNFHHAAHNLFACYQDETSDLSLSVHVLSMAEGFCSVAAEQLARPSLPARAK